MVHCRDYGFCYVKLWIYFYWRVKLVTKFFSSVVGKGWNFHSVLLSLVGLTESPPHMCVVQRSVRDWVNSMYTFWNLSSAILSFLGYPPTLSFSSCNNLKLCLLIPQINSSKLWVSIHILAAPAWRWQVLALRQKAI